MSNPNPKNQVTFGATLNKAGNNQFTNRPKELRILACTKSLEVASECIDVLISIMRNSPEEKNRIVCVRELLDRGIGKAQQSIVIDSSTGQPLSTQTTIDIVEKAMKEVDDNEAMAREILELKEQIKWLNSTTQATSGKGKKEKGTVKESFTVGSSPESPEESQE